MKQKIYDCFTYFNEDRLLRLRLKTMWDIVDCFVVCEATLTHAGNPKPINFNIENFKEFQSKIRYLLITEYPFQTNDPWKYESYQRNYLANGLLDASDEDWIIVSDLDEIPNPEAVLSFNPNYYLRASLVQGCYAYFLNNMQIEKDGTPSEWTKAKITTYRSLRSIFKYPECVREYRSTSYFRSLLRIFINKISLQKIKNGGWHFTWMGSVKNILLKLESFAHQEFNSAEFKNPDEIIEKIKSGRDLLNRDFQYQLQISFDNLPKTLQSNFDEYQDWVLMPESK